MRSYLSDLEKKIGKKPSFEDVIIDRIEAKEKVHVDDRFSTYALLFMAVENRHIHEKGDVYNKYLNCGDDVRKCAIEIKKILGRLPPSPDHVYPKSDVDKINTHHQYRKEKPEDISALFGHALVGKGAMQRYLKYIRKREGYHPFGGNYKGFEDVVIDRIKFDGREQTEDLFGVYVALYATVTEESGRKDDIFEKYFSPEAKMEADADDIIKEKESKKTCLEKDIGDFEELSANRYKPMW